MTSRWLNISTSQLSYGMFPSLSVPRSWNSPHPVPSPAPTGPVLRNSWHNWNDVWISMSCSWKLHTFLPECGWRPMSLQFWNILDGLYSLYSFYHQQSWWNGDGWLLGFYYHRIFGSRNCQLRLGSLELATPRSASPPQTTGVPTSEEWGGF